jgi:hypothetical protein
MADSSIPEGLPEGIGPHEVALMSWAAQEKILRHAREITAHVESRSPRSVGGIPEDVRVIDLSHALVALEDAAADPLQDPSEWTRGITRFLEALAVLKKEGMIA